MLGETLGSYRIVSEIGKGGMGVVYLAEHTLLGRKAAVKLLRNDVNGDQVERFFNEARAAATLHHPGLVDVFDFGHHANGSAYIVMEFLHGESLAERLDREPRFPVAIACAITRSVANALHVAHQEGIIHRDLKPGNIFLIPDRDAPAGVRTKVLDFGIAKLIGERQQPRTVHTHSGAVIGTPRYMSPEQCKNARTVDGRADIYSLGCILYEMLLGVAPFDYDTWAELVGAHLYEVPPRPTELDPAVPKDVEDLVVRMLEKAPEDRYQSMQELVDALDELMKVHVPEYGMRFTPPMGLRPTPTGGTVRPGSGTKGKRDSSGDPTLPAPGDKRATDPTMEAVKSDTGPGTGTITKVAERRSRWPLIAGGVIAAAGAAALVVTVVIKKDPPEPAESAFIVVDHRGSDGSAQQAVPPQGSAVEGATPVAIDAGVAAAPPIDAGAAKPPKSGELDTAQLTRAFGRQHGAVTACFRSHSDQIAEQISVRFQIDKQGKVVAAEVLPASVASTPLGTCLDKVARATEFGAQPKAVTFRVPIHATPR